MGTGFQMGQIMWDFIAHRVRYGMHDIYKEFLCYLLYGSCICSGSGSSSTLGPYTKKQMSLVKKKKKKKKEKKKGNYPDLQKVLNSIVQVPFIYFVCKC